ncbi:Psi-producing oxygenase A [Hypsizygus marmoreus]|uniref:Psi-producing oxygenase A n=1 Tax=Hypsizygus marmoreus TaxID=39966 RepID=A0A369J5S2_HYPMA|nr:Psi-producing oxygenase A [Hypsizygus marmoreus]
MSDIGPVKALTIGSDAVHLARRPPPIAPTGYYDWQVSNDPASYRHGHSQVTNLVNRAQTLIAKGVFRPDQRHIDAFRDVQENPSSIDDRKGTFPMALGVLARLDPHSDLTRRMNDFVIDKLYNTVDHPPASYLGPVHSFRQADGGGNNLHTPDLGRGGTPYARSVQGKEGLPATSLPDPGLIFDTILRKNGHQNHPGRMSSLIFAFASIMTHSLFRTDQKDLHINNASSYLDLSPLYGDNQEAQDKVRNKALGRGLLHPDVFSENRLMFLPAATSVLLVLFSRNHNYIAEKILKINERQLWSDPPPDDAGKRALQDEQIFQTAKLINCGHFMGTIMGNYVAGFIGAGEGVNWNMNAFDPIDTKDRVVERGLGNHISVEFNILYRWHATMSEADEKWTEDVFNQVFSGKPFDQLTTKDIATIAEYFSDIPTNPIERTFFGLKRGPDGKFSDDDLAHILHTATENPAGSFGGHGTPGVLHLVEIMGIQQARQWGVCTMNEFREFLGLRRFETFEEWNPDPEIASAARRIYGHINNLELYTGLQAESTMPLMIGSRFACGYTMTHGVLGDAIALVHGDRFFTTDFSSTHLTTWGFHDCQRDMNNGAMGGQIPRLLHHHLPRHFPWNSVHSLFPLYMPQHMKASLMRQGLDTKYTFDRPMSIPVPKVLNTVIGIKTVFGDPLRFKAMYKDRGQGSISMFYDQHATDTEMVLQALFSDKQSSGDHAAWFAASLKAKIHERSWRYPNVPGKHVDIVRDVINIVSVHFAADKLTGVRLKTTTNPSGFYTENELYDMLTIIFTYAYFTPPVQYMSLKLSTETLSVGLITKSLIEISPSLSPSFLSSLAVRVSSLIWPPRHKPCYPFLNRLVATGRPLDEMLDDVLGITTGASVGIAHAAVNVIDFYFDEARRKEKEHIIELVNQHDSQSIGLLHGYIREAMRLKPPLPGLWREALVNADVPQGPGLPALHIKAGDRIWGSFRNAHLNPLDFPDPLTVDLHRPLLSYHLIGTGVKNDLWMMYSQQTLTEVVKAVFKLKNVRRAAGNAGKLTGFTEIIHDTERDFHIQRNGTATPWPGSMHIVYDE